MCIIFFTTYLFLSFNYYWGGHTFRNSLMNKCIYLCKYSNGTDTEMGARIFQQTLKVKDFCFTN